MSSEDMYKRSESLEDFLKAVYVLQQQVNPVPTNLLAQMLDIKPPSVTDMVKRLAGIEDEKDKKRDDEKDRKHKIPLLEYEPYNGVKLTPTGEKIALEVIR